MLLFNELDNNYPVIFTDFNTSNVTIQQCCREEPRKLQDDFNTSNVTIQHITIFCCLTSGIISIHLMLLFNDIDIKRFTPID